MTSWPVENVAISRSFLVLFVLVVVLLAPLPALAADSDGDGIDDSVDNCLSLFDVTQSDRDGDGQGDACDQDNDNDGLLDSEEDLNANQTVDLGETDPFDADTDDDGYGDGMEVTHSSDPLDEESAPAHGDPSLNVCLADASQETARFAGSPLRPLTLQTQIRDIQTFIDDEDWLVASEGMLVQIANDPNSLANQFVDFTAPSPVTGSSSVTTTNSIDDVIVVVTEDGEVEAWHMGNQSDPLWSEDAKRGFCVSDSISADPKIHLRRYASEAFQSKYLTDLVYVGTRFSAGCTGGDEDNQVIAFNGNTGAVEWRFNGAQTSDVDQIRGLLLDETSDRLYAASDRNDPTQDSLWAIDTLTGTQAWSVNVGPVWGTPLMHGDRLYVLTTAGEIKALDKATGAIIWNSSNGGVPFTHDGILLESPSGETIIVGIDIQGNIFRVRDDEFFGTALPAITLAAGVDAIPGSMVLGLGGKNIFIGGTDGRIYQVDNATGTVEASRLVAEGRIIEQLVLQEDNASSRAPALFATTNDGQLHRFCQPFRTNTALIDSDSDGVTDGVDNCPNDVNALQTDTDQDGIGDLCDPHHRFHFKVGGRLVGLSSNGSVVLQNNGADDLVLTENGDFLFSDMPIDFNNPTYNVTVLTQPTMPSQVCEVENGSGTLTAADIVPNIMVTCTTVVVDTHMVVRVDSAKASLNLKKIPTDSVEVLGEFWLDPGSDDIRTKPNGAPILDEAVTVKFDGRPAFEHTFPAGSLREKDVPDQYEAQFKDPAGPTVSLAIYYVEGEFHGTFAVKWSKRFLRATPSPTVEEAVIASDLLSPAPVAIPFDLDIGNDNGLETGINFRIERDKKNKRVYQFIQEVEDTPYGVPLSFQFRAGGFVDLLLIDVDTAWVDDPTWFLDVEITGINGGFAHHGMQRLAVVDADVFDTNPEFSELVFTWTTDTKPESVNEVYTICSQVIHVVNGQDTLVGTQKCQSF